MGVLSTNFHPVPKPVDKKKKKKQNGYRDKANRYCYYCHTPYAERHEVYGGANRQISIDHEFQVDLCPECHRRMHSPETEQDRERVLFWKVKYQTEYEEKLLKAGATPKQARSCWMKLIGRNYKNE